MENLFNRRILALIFAAGLVACDGGDNGTDNGTNTDTDGGDCVAGIASTFPEADATGVYYRTAIDVRFTQEETADTASLSLATAGGDAVSGTATFDGRNASFAWAAPLAPSTEYVLTVEYSCDRTANVSFTTSAVGTPIDADDLIGNVYNIDIGDPDIRIVEPPGVGDLLGGLLADQDVPAILVSPSEYDAVANEITMIGAIGGDGGSTDQDTCTESIVFPEAADYSENPYFEIAGENVEIAAAGVVISLQRIEVSGAFAPDGSAIAGARLAGKIDTNALGDLLGDLGDVCALVAGFGVQCEDCGDGSITCLSLVADNITAARVSTDGLIEITAEDIADDPDCDED